MAHARVPHPERETRIPETAATVASVNLGGRPRKVRFAFTSADHSRILALLARIAGLVPENTPTDLETVPEQYRAIILANVNAERDALIAETDAVIAMLTPAVAETVSEETETVSEETAEIAA